MEKHFSIDAKAGRLRLCKGAGIPVLPNLARLAGVFLFVAAMTVQPMKRAEAGGRIADPSRHTILLNATRKSPSDLEVGGELAGLPPGTTRYVPLDALLALPQKTYTVTDDPSFAGPAKISGVTLEELARMLGAAPESDMVVAICDDKYRVNYQRAYVMAHH
jgi:hypothetical protein